MVNRTPPVGQQKPLISLILRGWRGKVPWQIQRGMNVVATVSEGSSYHGQKVGDLILGGGGIYLVISLSDLENSEKLPPTRCFPTTQI